MTGTDPQVVLSATAFREAAASTESLICILHRGGYAACADQVAAFRTGTGESWTWARVDLDQVPEVGTMLGIDDKQPWLLMMREQVMLYRAPLSAAPPERTRTLIDRAAGLDIERVHADIARDRSGGEALHARRACPTVWRRGPDGPA